MCFIIFKNRWAKGEGVGVGFNGPFKGMTENIQDSYLSKQKTYTVQSLSPRSYVYVNFR